MLTYMILIRSNTEHNKSFFFEAVDKQVYSVALNSLI